MPIFSQSKMTAMAVLVSQLVLTSAPTMAGERESLEQLRSTTTNLVNLLVQEGVLSKNKADALMAQAAKDAEAAKAKDVKETTQPVSNQAEIDQTIDQKMVRVQYVPEVVKQEMKEEIKSEVMESLNYKAGERLGLPSWIDRFVWEGDLRLRYEHQGFASNNPTALNFNQANNLDGSGFQVNNTSEDRNLFRARARFGFQAKVNDWMSGGVRLTTGSLNDSLSGEQTLESATAKYTVGLDRAFIKADVKPWLAIKGGRFENPFMSTDLVWDADFPFDGAAAIFNHKISNRWSAFGTLGAFPLDEIQKSEDELSSSKWLIGAQGGIKWTSNDNSSVKLGLAVYEFKNVEGKSNPANQSSYDSTAPTFRTKGNSYFDINELNNSGNTNFPARYALASKFRELNLTGQVDIAAFDPVHIILTGDYVRNIGFDKNEIARRTGLTAGFIPKKEVDGYQVKVAVGMPQMQKKNDWQAFAAYKYLEADAVLDSYTDSDFYLRGTNAKGWIVGGSYGIDTNTWITARWLNAEEISPRNALDPLSIDVVQLDLNSKF